MSYPKAPDDQVRVDFLRDLAILDSSPDENLDHIVAICRDVFGVETSTISLVDAERQWFKAVVGLDVCETDRDVAFCNHTILGDDIFEVCDALDDPRFRDNALVTGPPHIRYYAGAPLLYDGMRLGALCLIDYAPRAPLTVRERSVLSRLAEVVVHEIRTTRVIRESLAALVSAPVAD